MSTVAYVLGIVLPLLILAAVFDALRRRRLRERHAVWWILAGVGSLAIGIYPPALDWLARQAGIEIPINLVFFGAIGVLFLVNLQHSGELTRLEDKTRVLAERVAMAELELQQIRDARGGSRKN